MFGKNQLQYTFPYTLYLVFRWMRLTFRRYGLHGVFRSSYRPRHAGIGVGVRVNPYGRAHGRTRNRPVWVRYMLSEWNMDHAGVVQ